MDFRTQLQVALKADYTIERELGGGGMSRVFVATEHKLGRRVVIKVLSTELAATLSTSRFEREIQLAASLQQANIVPVLTAGLVEGTPYYTMPYIEGESLRARLARGPLSEHETLSILRDVARALLYAHQRGIVHRDIKPDNVLLSGEAAVVTDFGIAKAISAARALGDSNATSVTQVGTAIGTPAYMAPEQAAGDPDTDHRADIYAFGCLAFELLTGAPPFHGLAPHKLMVAHMAEPAPMASSRVSQVNPTLDLLVARCLDKSPDERPQTAREVLRALESAASSASRESLPAGLSGRHWSLPAALGIWGAAFGATWVLAKAAVVGIGLPDGTVPVALGAAALGLPAVLLTWYVQHSARRALFNTPTLTPGGSVVHSTVGTMALRAVPYVSWKRTWGAGAISGGVVAVGVAVVMILRAFGMGPAASLLNAGTIGKDSRVLVAQFASTATDTSLGSIVAQAMRTSLGQSQAIQLVPASDVAAGLRRMQLPMSTVLEEKTVRELALREGVPLVVSGQVATVGNGFMITANLVRADSGTVLVTLQEGANGAGDLLDAIDKVARGMRSRIGESLRSLARTPPLAQVTTSSLAALRAYSRGVEAGDMVGDWEKGRMNIAAAVKEDSTFAQAWRKLAVYQSNAGALPSVVFASTAAAYRFRERLPDIERADVEAYYIMALGQRQGANYYAAHPELSQNNRVIALYDLGEYAAAESLALSEIAKTEALGQRPIAQIQINLLISQMFQGKLNEAKRTADVVHRDYPGSSGAEQVDFWIASLLGQDSLDATIALVGTANRGRTRAIAARVRANVAAGRGQLRRAALLSQVAAAVEDTTKFNFDPVGWAAINVALQSALLGTEVAGVRVLDSLAESISKTDSWHDRPDLRLAAAYAQLGRPDKANALINTFEQTATREERLVRWGDWQAARGEVALAENRTSEAVVAFRQASYSDSGEVDLAWHGGTELRLARAFDKAGEADSAIAHFERVSSPGMRFGVAQYTAVALPSAPRRLGELYEAKGDLANAIKNYEAFVKLWKNADAELQPQVAEIRTRITRLQTAEAKRR